ncbi:hypothetical protein, partial [Klebsiella pneumoniae]
VQEERRVQYTALTAELAQLVRLFHRPAGKLDYPPARQPHHFSPWPIITAIARLGGILSAHLEQGQNQP